MHKKLNNQNSLSLTLIPLGFQGNDYAFGSSMPGYSFKHDSTDGYRYGFNNQEKESELRDYYSFEYRIQDARLGRFLSVDPLGSNFPWYSTYQFAGNKPIYAIDVEGMEEEQKIAFKPAANPAANIISFLDNYAPVIIQAARSNGASLAGALVVLAQAGLESWWGNSTAFKARNNMFGLGNGGSMTFASLDICISVYFKTMSERWPEFTKLLSTKSISSDDINNALNSGIYACFNGCKPQLYSYNVELDETGQEPIKLWVYKTENNITSVVWGGANNYGGVIIDVIKSICDNYIGYIDISVTAINISNLNAQREIDQINNTINSNGYGTAAQGERLKTLQNTISQNNAEKASLLAERAEISNLVSIIDTGTNVSSNQINIRKENGQYKNNIKKVETTE